MKNFTLIVIYTFFCIPYISSQVRVTDISNDEQNLKYCLMKTVEKNYVVTIAPDDLVEFYQINADQTFDLVNSVTIPAAYATEQENRFIEHGHFIIFNNTQIINYNLETDIIIYHNLNDNQNDIDNSLHPDHLIDWSNNRTSYSTSFLYDYTQDILKDCNENIYRRHKNHITFLETKKDSMYFYYSDGNCFNKELFYKFRVGPNGCDPEAFLNANYSYQFDLEMYPSYLYYIDSIGALHKYDYETKKSTKIMETQNVKGDYISVLETENTLVILNPSDGILDTSYISFYDKLDFTFKFTIKLLDMHHFSRCEIKESHNKFIINSGNNDIIYWDPKNNFLKKLTDRFLSFDARPYFHGDSYVLPVKKGSQYYFQLGDLKENKTNLVTIGNTYHFPHIVKTEEVKVGDYTYFNWVSNTAFKSIYVYDKTLKKIEPIKIGNFNQGISRKSPLVKIGNRQYLLNDECVEIYDDKYKTISNQSLTSLVYPSEDKYRYNESGILFAERDGDFKSIYLLQKGIKKLVKQMFNDTKLNDVNVVGDYVMWIDVHRNANVINTKTNVKSIITNGLWPFKNARYILTDGKFFYLHKLDASYIYDPISNVLKSLFVKENSQYTFVTRIHDASIIIIDNKLCKINDNSERDIIDIGIPNYVNSNYVEVKNNNLYSLAKSNNLQYLYKYDGLKVKIIESAPFIHIKNISEKGILYNSSSSSTGPLTTMFYDADKDKVFQPTISASSNIMQVFNHKNKPYFLVQAPDSIQVVTYTEDYSSAYNIFSEYAPLKIYATSFGETPDGRTLISTGRSFYFIDENENTTRLKDLIPNEQQHNIFINDSIFYFMAIDRSLGNQVYSLNHDKLSKLTSTHEDKSVNHSFSIFPNPAYNELNITTNLQKSESKLSIYDMNGIKVISKDFSLNTKCNLSDLSTGIYICQIKSGAETFRRKFIKM